ncbi:hypothetical protein [Streptomyces sp. NPDC056194]|uniref:hypothetical protein n=1 Tax=Streptomyces sp. NPDC056194 TaxID=3345744 RepID=UPI0035D923BA
MNPLEDDLKQVRAELAAAELEYQRLEAQIAALRAKEATLEGLIIKPSKLNVQGMTKAEAIVAVLAQSTEPMTLGQIADAVTAAGSVLKPDGASVYLDGLLKAEKVVRVKRGLYRAA